MEVLRRIVPVKGSEVRCSDVPVKRKLLAGVKRLLSQIPPSPRIAHPAKKPVFFSIHGLPANFFFFDSPTPFEKNEDMFKKDK